MVSRVISFDEIVKRSIQTYRDVYGSDPEFGCCAPGRVNLIGEHVDYNDGFVLPMALPMVTVIVGSISSSSSQCDIYTGCEGADDTNRVKFDVKNITKGTTKWINYVKGVIFNYGANVPGFNAVIMSNVPVGGGLSSSAALEVATLKFLELITKYTHEKLSDKALICQKAEHTFADMPCGIMDQLISVMGKERNALLINCQNLETSQIPFETNDLAVLICNSNVKHELSSSEYPTRRKQCNQALKLMGLKSYKDATLGDLEALENCDELLLRRARHVITEIKRTVEAASALKQGDFVKMGKLMTESHLSLRDDFQVSCYELDILVDAANNSSGVLGSRMTGGGFGGCTVILLYKNNINSTIKTMDAVYSSKTDGKNKANFYVCEPSEGARFINLCNFS
uniref:Putative galactitol metabolic process n=1 Tax=Corethrella appendiculata TaxID=1370023 RepID=U5EZ50_9DIPT